MKENPGSPLSSDGKEDSPPSPSPLTRGQAPAHLGEPRSTRRSQTGESQSLAAEGWALHSPSASPPREGKCPGILGNPWNFGSWISSLKEWNGEINSDLHSPRLWGLTQQDLQSAFKIQFSGLRRQAAAIEEMGFPARGVASGAFVRKESNFKIVISKGQTKDIRDRGKGRKGAVKGQREEGKDLVLSSPQTISTMVRGRQGTQVLIQSATLNLSFPPGGNESGWIQHG